MVLMTTRVSQDYWSSFLFDDHDRHSLDVAPKPRATFLDGHLCAIPLFTHLYAVTYYSNDAKCHL
jgi:hypothetical protein